MSQDPRFSNPYRNFPPLSSFFLGIGILLVCYVLANSVLGVLFQIGSEESLFDVLRTPEGRMQFRAVQGLSNLLSWGLAAYLWALFTQPPGKQWATLGMTGKATTMQLVLGGLLLTVAIPLAQWLLIQPEVFRLPEFMEGFEQWTLEQEATNQEFLLPLLQDPSAGALVANLITIAVVPAIAEEMFFRGYMLTSLRRMMNPHLAIALSAVLFSVAHLQFLGFFSRLVLGMLLGYAFLLTGKLWVSMVGHFIHNALNILLVYLSTRGILGEDLMRDDYYFPMWLNLISLGLTITVMIWLYRLYSNNLNIKHA